MSIRPRCPVPIRRIDRANCNNDTTPYLILPSKHRANPIHAPVSLSISVESADTHQNVKSVLKFRLIISLRNHSQHPPRICLLSELGLLLVDNLHHPIHPSSHNKRHVCCDCNVHRSNHVSPILNTHQLPIDYTARLRETSVSGERMVGSQWQS